MSSRQEMTVLLCAAFEKPPHLEPLAQTPGPLRGQLGSGRLTL